MEILRTEPEGGSFHTNGFRFLLGRTVLVVQATNHMYEMPSRNARKNITPARARP